MTEQEQKRTVAHRLAVLRSGERVAKRTEVCAAATPQISGLRGVESNHASLATAAMKWSERT